MKELEKRIEDIDKGQMENLHMDFDYRKCLVEQLPEINDKSLVIYRTKFEELLAKVDSISKKSTLITNTAINVFDIDGDLRTPEQQYRNYKEFEKEMPRFDNHRKGGDVDLEEHIEHSAYLMRFEAASSSKVKVVTNRIMEELKIYKKLLSMLVGREKDQPALKKHNLVNTQFFQKLTNEDKIRKILDQFERHINQEDRESLTQYLSQYFDSDNFTLTKQPTKVTGKFDRKALLWAFHEIYFMCRGGKIPDEYIIFVKDSFSIYDDITLPNKMSLLNTYFYSPTYLKK